jgi:hypothetical protein
VTKLAERIAPEPVRIDKALVCSICGLLVPEHERMYDGKYFAWNHKKKAWTEWYLTICLHCGLLMDEVEKEGRNGAERRMGMTIPVNMGDKTEDDDSNLRMR